MLRENLGQTSGLWAASPLTLEGTVPFRPSYETAVPLAGGVYLVHDLRGCLYIGRGDVIRDRFVRHYAYSHNSGLRRALRTPVGVIQFSWVLALGDQQRALEKRLITELQPLCNEIRYIASQEKP